MGKIRGTHSSPGVFTQISSLSYAAKTLGITSLGLVGETKKGPAFEAIEINKWDEYYTRFGGTDPELYKDSQYPRYELPNVSMKDIMDMSTADSITLSKLCQVKGVDHRPILLMQSKKDRFVPYAYFSRLARELRKYTNDLEAFVVEGDEHYICHEKDLLCMPISFY